MITPKEAEEEVYLAYGYLCTSERALAEAYSSNDDETYSIACDDYHSAIDAFNYVKRVYRDIIGEFE